MTEKKKKRLGGGANKISMKISLSRKAQFSKLTELTVVFQDWNDYLLFQIEMLYIFAIYIRLKTDGLS